METLDSIKSKFDKVKALSESAPSGPTTTECPFWVVVVNPRRSPCTPKFVSGHMTAADAEHDRFERQERATANAKSEDAARKAMAAKLKQPKPADFEPFHFFVIERPAGGKL